MIFFLLICTEFWLKSFSQLSYLHILVTDFYNSEPALVMQYLILCQHQSHLVVLSDNCLSLCRQQDRLLHFKTVHDLLNVSK